MLKGEHLHTGKVVALKHVFFQMPQRGQDAAAVREKRGRELAALKAVSHPNVVQLLEALSLVRRRAHQHIHFCTSMQAIQEQKLLGSCNIRCSYRR